jgi:hypothetical protein
MERKNTMSRRAFGGKTIYGARVGILMLDTAFPRAPGDTGNADTWPFPVLYKVVKGATAREVVHEKGGTLRQAFLDAAADLVREGADGITTTGGFLSVFQKDLADHVGVPVASSSLMQIPLAQSLLPRGKRVGILTVQGERLGPDHLKAIDVDPTTPIVGTEKGTELTRVLIGNEREMDYEAAEQGHAPGRRGTDAAPPGHRRDRPGMPQYGAVLAHPGADLPRAGVRRLHAGHVVPRRAVAAGLRPAGVAARIWGLAGTVTRQGTERGAAPLGLTPPKAEGPLETSSRPCTRFAPDGRGFRLGC